MSLFAKKFAKKSLQEICHSNLWKNAFPRVSEFSFFIFLWKVQTWKYKGNFQKYKGKMLIMEFFKFWFEIFFFSILNFMAAFLRSQRFFWYPYCHMILCHMSCQYASKYVIFDIYGILWRIMARHLTSIHMSIWVSKEAWEPKETSHKV